ncbi:MAG: hypothetical protein ACYDA3_12835 [Gaiellaceae bacterium]
MMPVPTLLRKAYRAAADPRRTAREAIIFRDLAQFRTAGAKGFRRARSSREPRGTVLVISLSDMIYQLKLEGVLATSLRLDGFRPVVLTHADSRWSKSYFRAFGIDEFIDAESILDPSHAAPADAAAREFLDDAVGVQELKAFEYRGAKVGQQTLSSVSRRFQRGRISLDDADVRDVLPQMLAGSMRAVLAGEALIDRLQPDLVVFNEKGYARFGSIYDVALARNLNVIQFVSAGIHWRDALLFKRYTEETRRVHPSSLSADSWEHVRAMEWNDRHEAELRAEFDLRYSGAEKHPDAGLQEGKRILSADNVKSMLALDPAKKTAVLFSHVLWDANLFYGDDLFEDQEQWLVESVKAACANDSVNWIIKLHPANVYKAETTELNDEAAIRDAVGPLPPHVTLLRPETEINTYSLFAVADYGITIRGTIGMELPCFGIRTLTAGTGRYSGFGFTDDSSSASEYLGKLARINELPRLTDDETLLAKKHAYGLFRLRPFKFSSYEAHFMAAERLDHPLGHNLDLLLKTPEEVERAPDLRKFAEWANDREKLDYLAEPT